MAIEKKIISEISEKGSITFARFMEVALYDEEFGYYGSGNAVIGKKGDFFTSPHVHKSFGKIMSRFVVELFQSIEDTDFNIIEIGAGSGYLALDILDSLRDNFPHIYERVTYKIVEKSTSHMEKSTSLLTSHDDRIEFLSSITECGGGIRGVFISNELFDSLPFHRVIFQKGELKEIYVDYDGRSFQEVVMAVSTEKIKSYFQRYSLEFFENQQMEACLRAEELLKDISSVMQKGFVVTIDYGYEAYELFDPSRTRGTYKCMYQHKINENPYINIGKQDITHHVDFTNLMLSGEKVGLSTLFFKSQGQFLVDWGILEVLKEFSPEDADVDTGLKDRLAIKNLILSQFMGKVFKVLVQYKDISHPSEKLFKKLPFRLL